MLCKPTFGPVASGRFRNHPLYRGCIVHWMMHDGGGLVTEDVSGFNNSGALTSGPGWDTGAFGPALLFDGTDDYVVGSRLVNIPRVTISAWINIDPAATGGLGILGFFNGLANGTRDKVLAISDAGYLVFYAYDGTPRTTSTPTNTTPKGTWVHVVGTADGVNIKAYENGVEVGTAACGDTYQGYAGPNIFLASASPADFSYFKGKIDNVQVYDYALTMSQIRQLYNDPFVMFRRPIHRAFFTIPGGAGQSIPSKMRYYRKRRVA